MSKRQRVIVIVLICFLLAAAFFDYVAREQVGVKSADESQGELHISESVLETVTGRAVSGGVMEDSLQDLSVKEGRQPQRYASARAIYRMIGDGTITQYDKTTGKEENFYPEKLDNLLYVSEDALYYAQKDNSMPRDPYRISSSNIYRVPLKTQEDGSETVEFQEGKKILDVPEGILNIYVYSHYVVYMDYLEQGYLHCYDFESGLDYKAEIGGIGIDFKYGLDGAVILCSINMEGYWCFDISTRRLVHFEDAEGFEFYPGVRADNAFFYEKEGDLYVYDIKREKRCRLLTEEELGKFCKKNASEKGEFSSSSISELYVSEGRLYIQMTKTWLNGKKTVRTNHMVLSLDLTTENRELCYEKELSDFIGSNGLWLEEDEEYEDYGDYEGEYNSSGLLCVDGEKAIVVINGEEWELYSWHLPTGEKKRIGEKDGDYYLPYANVDDLEEELDDEFNWNIEC